MDIDEHEPFVMDKTYQIYLSNLEVPNIVFAATLDDYVKGAELLNNQGVVVARRTVAKYREAMNIAHMHLRKAI